MYKASVVICHGGCGSISLALRAGKVPIVVPRQKRYGEHVNDHQLQLTQALASEKRVLPLYEIDDLPNVIAKAYDHQSQPVFRTHSPMVTLVSQVIESLASRS